MEWNLWSDRTNPPTNQTPLSPSYTPSTIHPSLFLPPVGLNRMNAFGWFIDGVGVGWVDKGRVGSCWVIIIPNSPKTLLNPNPQPIFPTHHSSSLPLPPVGLMMVVGKMVCM